MSMYWADGCNSIREWLREYGLAPCGFALIDWGPGAVLLRTWAFGRRARWEIYMGIDTPGLTPPNSPGDFADWLAPLPVGSSEAMHRLQIGAQLVCHTNDEKEARWSLQWAVQPNEIGLYE